jgi:hypothetical protein
MGAYISAGNTYTIGSLVPSSSISYGSVLNTSGNTLSSLRGIYLFDVWNNNINGLDAKYISLGYASSGVYDLGGGSNAAIAGIVQTAIWQSLGYSNSAIAAALGVSSSNVSNIETAANNMENSVTDLGSSYSNSWVPTDVTAFYLDNGAQDQIFLSPTVPNSGNPQITTPEPTSMIVWGVGAGLAGAAAVRRGDRRRGRWSKQNRQAILNVIERGRHLSKF